MKEANDPSVRKRKNVREVKNATSDWKTSGLKKTGSPDVRVSVEQSGQETFTSTENGVSSAIWPKYSPEQLKSGNTPRLPLDGAWQTILVKYPDYEATALEELTPDGEKAS